MTALSSENQVKIVNSFFKNRPMKVHWIQIPKKISSAIAELFNEYNLEELAKVLELKIAILSQFQIEMNELKFIKDTLVSGEETGESKQVTYYKIKSNIEKLYGLLSLRRLAEVLNIPKTTLWDMSSKNSRNKKEKGPTHLVTNNISTKNITKNTTGPAISIDSTKELRELHQMLARHANKTQKKYSKSEKDLILKLVDRFGSKLVHEQVKVSYDTIARLLRQRKRGYIVPSTKAEFMPVIDTMKKFPGMGPMQVRDYNHRHHGVSMGVNTVRKVMEDNGWYPSYSRKVVITKEPRRYEAIRRNYMWHLDFKQFYINKCKVYLPKVPEFYYHVYA